MTSSLLYNNMASSSVSQEEPDMELSSSRRSRVRTLRARNANRIALQHTDSNGTAGDAEDSYNAALHDQDGFLNGSQQVEHDTSPKPTSRAKDKRPPRINHMNKGKAPRDRRKLREKRRSTGVVHLPSTESTGGSTGEDEDELLSMTSETKKNTIYNEMVDHHDSTIHEDRVTHHRSIPPRRNKSPSDLDADDEDNQDYDSTVNQSDSTISLNKQDSFTNDHAINNGSYMILSNRSRAVNGRPDTPDLDNMDELLERAREENCSLLDLLAEKDKRISALEREVFHITKELQNYQVENSNLKEENQTLVRAMAQLHVT